MVQLPHLYMTTGKTIALTRWTFVGKIMSLLFNTLSRFDTWVGEIPWRRKWQPSSSTLAWKTPWTDGPCRLQSMGSQRVGHNWATSLTHSRFVIAFLPRRKHLLISWLQYVVLQMHKSLLFMSSGVSPNCFLIKNSPFPFQMVNSFLASWSFLFPLLPEITIISCDSNYKSLGDSSPTTLQEKKGVQSPRFKPIWHNIWLKPISSLACHWKIRIMLILVLAASPWVSPIYLMLMQWLVFLSGMGHSSSIYSFLLPNNFYFSVISKYYLYKRNSI